MANTTYFGWETPDDTDLVKDGAAAIRTLGSAIDTSLADLEGGTTGQILAKNSNTDMDFIWVTNDVGDITEVVASTPLTGGGSSGSVTVGIQDGTTAQKGAVQLEDSTSSTSTTKASTPNSVKSAYDLANGAIAKSLIDAEGDLIVGDAADLVQRLAIGSNAQVLTVDTSVDGKIKWATPAGGGGKVLQVVQGSTATQVSTTSTSLVNTGLEVTITPTLATSKVLILVSQQFYVYYNAAAADSAFSILRGATVIFDGVATGKNSIAGVTQVAGYYAQNYLDTPATTSATTYKTQFCVANSSITSYAQNASHLSTIIALEIGA